MSNGDTTDFSGVHPPCRVITNFVPAMQRIMMKSKIHRVRVTEADLDYIGSITIDENLMEASNLAENEQVHVFNYRNGERIITYVIKGQRGSGIICLNGPAAIKFSPGDEVIVVAYANVDEKDVAGFTPAVIFPDSKNNNSLKA
jgi:aspartate 1-decarboxylase